MDEAAVWETEMPKLTPVMVQFWTVRELILEAKTKAPRILPATWGSRPVPVTLSMVTLAPVVTPLTWMRAPRPVMTESWMVTGPSVWMVTAGVAGSLLFQFPE